MRRLIREAAGAIALGAVLLLGAIVLPAPPAGAQAGTCLPYFNGADITGNESHAAHKIDGTRDLDLAIKSFAAVGIVTMKVEAGPWSKSFQPAPGAERADYSWAAAIPPSDFAAGGAGIFKVTIESTGGCQSIAWINITGKSVFETTPGRAGLAVLAVGVVAIAAAAFLAWRRNFIGVFFAVGGGLLAAFGVTVAAWQAGQAALVPLSLLVWGLPPLLLGGGAYALISYYRGPAADDDDDDEDDFDGTDEADDAPTLAVVPPPAAPPAPPPAPAPPPPAARDDDSGEIY